MCCGREVVVVGEEKKVVEEGREEKLSTFVDPGRQRKHRAEWQLRAAPCLIVRKLPSAMLDGMLDRHLHLTVA